jgi:hypothetical protein
MASQSVWSAEVLFRFFNEMHCNSREILSSEQMANFDAYGHIVLLHDLDGNIVEQYRYTAIPQINLPEVLKIFREWAEFCQKEF